MTDVQEKKEVDKETSPASSSSNRKKRNLIMGFLIFLFLLSAVAAVFLWWEYFRNYETTEDAYVNGNVIVLSSRQEGSVISCHALNTEYVQEGELLVRLDPTDYHQQLDKKIAELSSAARKVLGLYEAVQEKKANVRLATAKYERASLDVENRKALQNTEAIKEEDIQHAEAEHKEQSAALNLAKHELYAAEATLGSPPYSEHPEIEVAKVAVIEAFLALSRCSIKAPAAGYIANKNVQVGQPIKAGTPLMNIVPLNFLWVDANFKETQLSDIRIGQPVELKADMYGGDVIFRGKVEGLVPGSGSTFSLIPTQNATGNWIKIVQRVPVRISLDQEEVKKSPLILGLTMSVSVDISDTSGLQLADKPLQQSAKTEVFNVNLEEIQTLMSKIVDENLQLPAEEESEDHRD